MNNSNAKTRKKGVLSSVGDRVRKERSDKKRQVKPIIAIDTRETIHRIAHITATPLKDVCEFIICHVMQDVETINLLSTYFRRNVIINGTLHNGSLEIEHIGKRLTEPGEQVSITFTKPDYELICAYAYGLDCTPTRTTAILLQHATCDIKAVNEYVYRNLKHQLTDGQIKELKKVFRYINYYNNDMTTWASILSTIVGDVRPATKHIQEIVSEFLRK